MWSFVSNKHQRTEKAIERYLLTRLEGFTIREQLNYLGVEYSQQNAAAHRHRLCSLKKAGRILKLSGRQGPRGKPQDVWAHAYYFGYRSQQEFAQRQVVSDLDFVLDTLDRLYQETIDWQVKPARTPLVFRLWRGWVLSSTTPEEGVDEPELQELLRGVFGDLTSIESFSLDIQKSRVKHIHAAIKKYVG